MQNLLKKIEHSFQKRDDRKTLRLFHGDSEGESRLFIEKFSNDSKTIVWVNEKERLNRPIFTGSERKQIVAFIENFFKEEKVSVYWMFKPMKGLPPIEPECLLGEDCSEILTEELGLSYKIKQKNVRHPGLFLDHYPLRKWMIDSKAIKGNVLNTFSYTGSLSCAAFKGGAETVTTLDLSKSTIEWAKENWLLNQFPENKGDFIYGDYFEWLPRFHKKKRFFNAVILDPPSFSRGKNGVFSTKKDLETLHVLALSVLSTEGYLISSINSETISLSDYIKEIQKIVLSQNRTFQFIRELKAEPIGFPKAEHLKGVILKIK